MEPVGFIRLFYFYIEVYPIPDHGKRR